MGEPRPELGSLVDGIVKVVSDVEHVGLQQNLGFDVLLLCGGVALCIGLVLMQMRTAKLAAAGRVFLMVGLSLAIMAFSLI